MQLLRAGEPGIPVAEIRKADDAATAYEDHAGKMRTVSRRHRPESTTPAAEVRRAWLRYLRETQEAAPQEYERLELRAWLRLTSNLAALGAPLPDVDDAGSDGSDR